MELRALHACGRQTGLKSALRSHWRASLLLSIWLAVSFPAPAADSSGISLRWTTNSNRTIVEVVGLDAPTLGQLQMTNWQTEDWEKLLPVYARQGDFLADMSVPPMLGTYRVEDGLIRFQPRFPLERGVRYRAVFHAARLPGAAHSRSAVLIAGFQPPAAQSEPATVVSQVYPSGDVLPENLLKFYVHFSAPMQGGHIYEHIQLLDAAGEPVELPFLEIDEELWNPEMTRLTLFIDPGRIKSGVQPLEEIGPALEAGRHYTLKIGAAWRDSGGLPLRESFHKSFRVAAPDRDPPMPAAWKIKSPGAGTRDALTLIFPEPMDHALALRVIRVTNREGELLKGTTALAGQETRWTFTPRESWTAGPHQLQVQNTIEDLAGNNIGKAFEIDLSQGPRRRFTNQVVKLPFEVR